jgi:hypothetical protein
MEDSGGSMNDSQPKLRIAYLETRWAQQIIEEYSDGSMRKVRRPKSVQAMDAKRKRYGASWRGIRPVHLLGRQANAKQQQHERSRHSVR